VQDKEITDDKKIANCFNAYFTNAHRLANNLREGGVYFEVIPQIQKSNILYMYGNMATKRKLKKIVCTHYIDRPSLL